MKSFLLKIKLVKSLLKISIYDILINRFRIKDLNKNVPSLHCIPLSKYLEQFSLKFYYDSSLSTWQRKGNFFSKFVLLIHLINAFRNFIYIFFDLQQD